MDTFLKIFLLAFSILQANLSMTQIIVDSNATNDELVENFCGPGITFSNVVYCGSDIASGLFSNGDLINFGMNSGIILCSGDINLAPGPNDFTAVSFNNALPGDSLLSLLINYETWDASLLSFDFIPANDTVKFELIFGSEEYPEFVLQNYDDVCGVFLSGPNPSGDPYSNSNMALVPGTDDCISIWTINNVIPSYPEYYIDNYNGPLVQYDGYTTVIPICFPVVPDSEYNIAIGIADANDGIFDSGLFLKANSFRSQSNATIQSFSFLASVNNQLFEDISGVITDTIIHLEVPYFVDVTNLIASFETPPGVVLIVDGVEQFTGQTTNDFSEPLTYIADGSIDKTYTVFVEKLPGPPIFESFSFLAENNPELLMDSYGVISDSTVTLDIPYGTDVSNLVATFTLPYSVYATVNGTIQESGVTPNNYNFQVKYTLNGNTTREWNIILNIYYGLPYFIEFSFPADLNPQLPFDISGNIGASTITLLVPEGTGLSNLIASFTTPLGVIVKAGDEIQTSEITVNDFSDSLIYTLCSCYNYDYTVFVDYLTGIPNHSDLTNISISNSHHGTLVIRNSMDSFIHLFNINGLLLFESHKNIRNNEVLIPGLKPGVYFISFTNEKTSVTRKVTVY